MALTPSQQAAVLYDRNLILFAGPGSGKTATSVAKGRRILLSADASLCMVTFTTAAAAELRQRMASAFKQDHLSVPTARLTTSTFHSLALKHFQRHARNCPRLLPPPARSAMLHSMLAKYSLEQRGEFILSLERYQGALNPGGLEISTEQRGFIEDYLQKMRAANATDLASVMRDCTVRMSAGDIPLMPFTHFIGDEMQDADEVQLEFVMNHTRAGAITTLVADDDQTIYEWRCALGYAGLQHFAAKTGAKTITLAENFRSRNEIVGHALALIAHNNPERVTKEQRAVRGGGGVLGAMASANPHIECELVASAIAEFRYDDEEIGILARSNRSLEGMEQALAAEGVAYKREGPTIWDSHEIGTLLSLLRALLSSQTADLLPVLMLLPVDGKVRKALEASLGGSCVSFLDGDVPDLEAATQSDRKELAKFSSCTALWRRSLREGNYNLVIPDIGCAVRGMILNHVEAESSSARSRRASFLIDSATTVLTRLKGPLSARLSTLTAIQSREGAPCPVRLMTVHGSKGLEFDTVYLINATNPDDGSTLMDDNPERRLFYVALTRARDRFFVTYSDKPVKFIREAELPLVNSLSEMLATTEPES